MNQLSLLTDLYQLTMIAGYYEAGRSAQRCCFELYFRDLPFNGGYCVSAGLEDALEYLTQLRFEKSDLDYLRSVDLFSENFLRWLEVFRFSATVWGIPEGELVFPGEPLLRIEGVLPQVQLVESALLNIINFQTLVASKAARVCYAGGGDRVLEFGLRRAQGPDGALSASRAAYIGGCHATSNCMAGKLFGIPVEGTHAHSWIMSFETELEAFQTYADHYLDRCTLLVDTYDTLKSGLPNAIKVGRALAAKGHRLAGIRLDSGDLTTLSIQARRMLDEGGLNDTFIVASSDLDEYSIEQMKAEGCRIDIWGVGTNLVTCKDDPALGGVYKLAAAEDRNKIMQPRMKTSSNPAKSTLPGVKTVYRLYDEDSMMMADIMTLSSEPPPKAGQEILIIDPIDKGKQASYRPGSVRLLLQKVLHAGERLFPPRSLTAIRRTTLENLKTLPQEWQQLAPLTAYRVGVSEKLSALKETLEFHPTDEPRTS